MPADFLGHVEAWAERKGCTSADAIVTLIERAFKIANIIAVRRRR